LIDFRGEFPANCSECLEELLDYTFVSILLSPLDVSEYLIAKSKELLHDLRRRNKEKREFKMLKKEYSRS